MPNIILSLVHGNGSKIMYCPDCGSSVDACYGQCPGAKAKRLKAEQQKLSNSNYIERFRELPETRVENLCRLLCQLDKCDPDFKSVSIGTNELSVGFQYKLWEYRIDKAIAILKMTDEN